MKPRWILPPFLLALVALQGALLLGMVSASVDPAAPAQSMVTVPDESAAQLQDMGQASAIFIENVGQFDPGARFHVRGATESGLWLSEDAIWLTLVEAVLEPSGSPEMPGGEDARAQPQPRRAVNIKLSFVGANPNPRLVPFDRLDSKVSYFVGNDPERWRAAVPVWAGVRYVDLYPGVDLELSSEGGRYTQRVVTAGGANLSAVRLRVEGAEGAVALDDGSLRITSSLGEMILPLLHAAVADLNGLSRPTLHPGNESIEVAFPFTTGRAAAGPLAPTDDPQDLLYGTFLGGSEDDSLGGLVLDPNDDIVAVTGATKSAAFTTTVGAFDRTHNVGNDVYVVKLNPAGNGLNDLISATFLGGSSKDTGAGISIDQDGNTYIVGTTQSTDFPTTTLTYDGTFNDDTDAFVTKLNSSGTALIYSTYLGGKGWDYGNGIVVDNEGYAFVTGTTRSINFPTTDGAIARERNGGLDDVFVTRVMTDGRDLVYSTYVGGYSNDEGLGIDIYEGDAFVTGRVDPRPFYCDTDFPTTSGAYQEENNGCGSDAFVFRLKDTGSRLEQVYNTFLGGTDHDWGTAIAVDEAGNAYVTGSTASRDFPKTTDAYDTECGTDGKCNSIMDAFVTKLNADGTEPVYSTFLGGNARDDGLSLAVDATGRAYVSGKTVSNAETFPTTADAFDRSRNGLEDVFLAQLSPLGSGLADLDYATFLGGGQTDTGDAVEVDDSGDVYVGMNTSSGSFATTPDAFDPTSNGGQEALLVKLRLSNQISGTVIEESDNPLPLVLVSDGAGHGDVTDHAGAYTVTGLPIGEHTLIPTRLGFTFEPPTHTVSVPPNAAGQNYTAYRVGTGCSLHFDGLDDTVIVPHDDSLNIARTTTFEARLRLESLPTQEVNILNKWWTDGEDKRLSVDARGQIRFYLHDIFDDHSALVSKRMLSPGRWYHIAVTYDGSRAAIYIDGVEDNAKLASGDVIDSSGPLRLGLIQRSGSVIVAPFHGLIDQLRIWNISRSREEIRGDMYRLLSGSEPGLVAYWEFDTGWGQTAWDKTVFGNDGQLGPTTSVDGPDPSWDPFDPVNPCDYPVPGGLCAYHGDLHSHTNYSDGEGNLGGEGTPFHAYATARSRGLDFYAVTDYGQDLDQDEWDETLKQALEQTVEGEFVALRGFEWSLPGPADPHGEQGHINVFGAGTFIGTNHSSYDTLNEFYAWLGDPAQSSTVAQFNYPNYPAGSFSGLEYHKGADLHINLIEVGNDIYSHLVSYHPALNAGWRVAPTNNSNTHLATWGKRRARTGIVARSLSYYNVLEALRTRRTFSTEDENLVLAMWHGEYWMGSVLHDQPDRFYVYAHDPDSQDTIEKIEFFENGVLTGYSSVGKTTTTVSYTPQLEPITPGSWWYAKAIQSDGDVAYTSAIWFHNPQQYDVMVRDHRFDTGYVPSIDLGWVSPDILARPWNEPGYWHKNPVAGEDTAIRVQVRNIGESWLEPEIYLYWAPAGLGLAWPDDWHQIGVNGVPVPVGAGIRAERLIDWAVPSTAPDYIALAAHLVSAEDPIRYAGNVKWENNIAARSVHIVGDGAARHRRSLHASEEIGFSIANPFAEDKRADLFFAAEDFPDDGTLVLRLVPELVDRWLASDQGGNFKGGALDTEAKTFTMASPVNAVIYGLPLSATEHETVSLTINVPDGATLAVLISEQIDGQGVGSILYTTSHSGLPRQIELEASASIVKVGQSLEITATVVGEGYIPVVDGTELEFDTTLGILSQDTAATQNGMATIALDAGTEPGTALITARVHGYATATIPITITIDGSPHVYLPLVLR